MKLNKNKRKEKKRGKNKAKNQLQKVRMNPKLLPINRRPEFTFGSCISNYLNLIKDRASMNARNRSVSCVSFASCTQWCD